MHMCTNIIHKTVSVCVCVCVKDKRERVCRALYVYTHAQNQNFMCVSISKSHQSRLFLTRAFVFLGLYRCSGQLLMEQSKFKTAERLLKTAISLESGDWRSWNTLGDCHRKLVTLMIILSQMITLMLKMAMIRSHSIDDEGCDEVDNACDIDGNGFV